MKQLRFFRDDLAERHGFSMQRIPLDPGFACPHGRCAFCGADGSRARHLEGGMTIPEQVERGIRYVRDRYHSDGPYIAYFQAFTGTNAPIETIRSVYEEALSLADFRMIVIGTRPDCLPEECLDYLAELKMRYEVLVELGVQTANDETLRRINRGHDFACAADAARRLHARGIPVAAHLILGLPGETEQDWIDTARAVAALPFCAVKMHQLLVLKGTKLAAQYAAAPFPTLNEYEYAAALEKFLRELPDSMSVLRLTAESENEGIIAPKWWMKKGQFREMFLEKFASGQGRFTPCRTEDGTYTLYHPSYRQHFHSLAGAAAESVKKYLEPSGLAERLSRGDTVELLDIGFGLGCNARSAMALAAEAGKGKVRITSLESDRNVIPAALTLPDCDREFFQTLLDQDGVVRTPFADLKILFGDARKTLKELPEDRMFDVIFLDGFSPDTNPELWTADFLRVLADHLKPDGVLTTYSSAYPLFGAILEAGLHLYRSEPFGRKRPGTVAAKCDLSGRLAPLAQKDADITLRSTAGVPYRDPGLCTERDTIFSIRKEEVSRLRADGMPKWFKGSH